MIGTLEAWVVATILIVEALRRWPRLPSWAAPYVVFPVAWFVVFISSLSGGVVQAALDGLSQTTTVAVSAIIIYDLAGKPTKKKLVPFIRSLAKRLRRAA